MKKTILTVFTFFALMVGARAQDAQSAQEAQGVPEVHHNIPAYRARGYKGNVAVTSLGLYWNGVETSHGYMLNETVYLGGGAGLLIGAIYDPLPALRVFADAQFYWMPKKSTLTTRLRAGYLRNFYGESDMFYADLTLGGSWGVGTRYGISLDAGVSVIVPSGIQLASFNRPAISLAPVLSIAFEF